MIDPVTVGLLAAFAVLALANWWAVAAADPDRRQVAVTKTAATTALVAFAVVAGDMDGAARAALVVAVVLCLGGDVALLGKTERRFLAGLGSFLLGHVAYIVCALLVGVGWPRLAWAFPFIAAILAVQMRTRMIPRVAAGNGGAAMAAAVAAYSVVISTMVVTATGTPHVAAAVGAMVFAISDSIIGHDRFVAPVRRARVAVMSTYHVGQILLIAGLVAGG